MKLAVCPISMLPFKREDTTDYFNPQRQVRIMRIFLILSHIEYKNHRSTHALLLIKCKCM